MGDMIQWKRPDGKDCPGYLALPAAGKSAPAFVMIQEWWGLNGQIKNAADRLAEAGYRVLVPDLFRGKLAGDSAEASHMMGSLKAGGVNYELYRYDAQHAFMNENRPEVYDAACSKLAWERTLAFLKRTTA